MPEKHPTLRRIDICGDWQVDQARPGLAKIEVRLLRDGHIVVRRLAEEVRAQLHLGAGLIKDILCHGMWRHSPQGTVSEGRQVIWQFREVVSGEIVMRDRVGEIDLNVLAVIEPRDGYWNRSHPVGDGKAFFDALAL